MKLQLALDDIALVDALVLTQKIQDYVDIIEIGSPFIIEEGMRAVREFRKYFPEKEILADTKIMDAGEYEASQTFEAGADYCTVLGATDTLTIQGCLKAAQKYRKKVFVDMICVENVEARVAEIEAIGVNCIAVHIGVDQQAAGMTPLAGLGRMRAASKCSVLSVAGGIDARTVADYGALGADIVVVGGSINHATDPVATAKAIYETIQQL